MGERGRAAAVRVGLCALLALGSGTTARAEDDAQTTRDGPRVVLIGVDGFSWRVIDSLVAEGRMPNLAALMARGIHAEMATVEPVISPTVWTSIATGRSPEAHGITSFFGDSRDVAVPTIFERLAAQGLRVGAYDYLFTWPPQTLPDGFLIPGWLRRDDRTSPPDAFERAGEDAYRYSNQGIVSRPGYFDSSFEELARKPAQWQRLAQAFDLEAGALTFYATDALSHRFWSDSFPEQFDPDDIPEPEDRFAGAVQRAYQDVDAAIGQLVAGLPEDAAVLIASDHGFQAGDGFARRWAFRMEPELARAGFVAGREAFTMAGEFAFITLQVEDGPWAEREALLTELEAFFEGVTDEEGRPLFWAQPRDIAARPSGQERSLWERTKSYGLTLLARAIGIEVKPPEAHALLTMVPLPGWEDVWPDGNVRIGDRTVAARDVAYGEGFTGAHDPTAVFVAAGGGLRQLPGRQDFSVLGVAALYAWLAGGAIPDDLEGPLRVDWIEDEALAARPPKRVSAASLERLPRPEAPASSDAEVMERLRSMGYVE